MSVSLIILLSWLEGIISTSRHADTLIIKLCRKQLTSLRNCYHLLVDNFQCKMLLYSTILVLLLLQPALSSPVPLTTPSRGSPTSKENPTQSQPPVDLNATTLAVGEPCGVYTLGCGQGLRCAPPDDEPRPLRALLEGRGICTIASSASPTDEVQTAGKSHTLCLEGGEESWWIFDSNSLFANLFDHF